MAVFRLDPLGVKTEIVDKLEGLLRLELNRLADAAMPSKLRIEQLIAKRRGLRNCTGDPACLARAGKQLDVDRIISGNVGGLAGNYVVNLKLVDVATAKELRRVQETISGEPDQLIEAVRVAAYSLVAPERVRGSLRVLANVSGARVLFDGHQIGATPLPRRSGLEVGKHTLRVTKGGYTDVVQTVRIRFQKTAQVIVKMEVPAKSKGGGSGPGRAKKVPWYTRWWFWTIVGVAGAGLGVGLGFLLSPDATISCSDEPGRCGL